MKHTITKIRHMIALTAIFVPLACDGIDLCAESALKAGFPDSQLVNAVAIGMAESSCVQKATNSNGPTDGCKNGSTDRGLWQINDCYHKDVSVECAFDPECNAKAAYTISSGGEDWKPWATFNNKAYEQWLDEAKEAVERAKNH